MTTAQEIKEAIQTKEKEIAELREKLKKEVFLASVIPKKEVFLTSVIPWNREENFKVMSGNWVSGGFSNRLMQLDPIEVNSMHPTREDAHMELLRRRSRVPTFKPVIGEPFWYIFESDISMPYSAEIQDKPSFGSASWHWISFNDGRIFGSKEQAQVWLDTYREAILYIPSWMREETDKESND